jgi:hypothetical protein
LEKPPDDSSLLLDFFAFADDGFFHALDPRDVLHRPHLGEIINMHGYFFDLLRAWLHVSAALVKNDSLSLRGVLVVQHLGDLGLGVRSILLLSGIFNGGILIVKHCLSVLLSPFWRS